MNSKSVSGYFGGSEDLDRFRFKLDSNLWRDKLLKTSGYWKLFLMISSAKENGDKIEKIREVQIYYWLVEKEIK